MNVNTAHSQYLHPCTLSLVMKPNPVFLLSITLLALCGLASAQTTPAPAPNTHPGKGVSHPKRAGAPPRTASVSAVKIDTAAFRRGRPHDSILNYERDRPSKN
jgi:hypothetical protein